MLSACLHFLLLSARAHCSICTRHHCVFMSVSLTFASLPRGHLFLSEASAFIRLKCHGGFVSSFFLCLLGKDPFCQSKQFAINPPPPPTPIYLLILNKRNWTLKTWRWWEGETEFLDGSESKGWSIRQSCRCLLMRVAWWQPVFTDKYLFLGEETATNGHKHPCPPGFPSALLVLRSRLVRKRFRGCKSDLWHLVSNV